MGVMLGPIMGPTLGGWLTDSYSWRWVFFVNLPFGILTTVGLWIFMTETPTQRDVPFSWFGFLSLSLGIGALQMMLDRGAGARLVRIRTRSSSRRSSPSSASISFSPTRSPSKRPFINLRIFRDWNFSIALVFMFLIGIILLATMALVTPFIQNMLGYPVLSSGYLLGTRGIGTFVAMFLVGRLSGKVDPRILIFIGLVLATSSLWLMVGWSLDVSAQTIAINSIAQGFRPRLRVRAAQHHRLRQPARRAPDRGRGAVDPDPQHRLVGRHLGRHRPADEHDRRMYHSQLVEHLTPFSDALHMPNAGILSGIGLAETRDARADGDPAGGGDGLFERLPADDARVVLRLPAARADPLSESCADRCPGIGGARSHGLTGPGVSRRSRASVSVRSRAPRWRPRPA